MKNLLHEIHLKNSYDWQFNFLLMNLKAENLISINEVLL